MQLRGSSRLLWSGPLLGIAVFVLGGCATEMAEVESPPAAPLTAAPTGPWAPQPSPAAAPEPPRAEAAPPPPAAEAAPATPAPAPPEPAPLRPLEVTGVEVNAATVGILTKTYRDYFRKWVEDPRVTIVHGEGRHFLATNDRRYDVIQLSGVDSYSGTSAAAHVFSENYLYTAEAFDLYLSRLAPQGMLNLMRLEFKPPREMLRALTTAVTLDSGGVIGRLAQASLANLAAGLR